MNRTIIHADLNSFFAAVEQQANPFLRGKPVGIIKDIGRTCIIAASDEAKTCGVKTGMPLKEVKRLCPAIILVPADFSKYFNVTQRFIDLCSHYTPEIEVFSLDEVFLDVTQTEKIFNGALMIADDIQSRLKTEIGDWLGCSIGIAANKLLAKMASSIAPRKGVLVVDEDNKEALLAKIPFEEVCGIGCRLTRRLNNMGIFSLPQITQTPDKNLQAEFGPYWTKHLKRIARGEDNNQVIVLKQLPDAKSVSRTFTLFHNTTNPDEIKGLIRNLVEEATGKLRQMGLSGRQFGISVRGHNLGQSKHVTRKYFTDNGRVVFDEVYRLFNNLNWRHPVRFVGIWISLLTRKNYLSQPLFIADREKEELLKAVDHINQRYGDYAIHPGTLLYRKIIRPEVNGFLGDKQFQFRTL